MKFWYNPNFLAILSLLILSIPALKSLAIPNFYTSHDGETHAARIAAYYQALSDGQFPPRFAGNFYNGLGSPIFVYIYPLPYFLGSAIASLGFSFIDSFEILMAAGFALSAFFAYLWLREVIRSEKAAFLGALFYTWVPYRFLLLYVRGSISELLAYTFLPLVFYLLTKLAREKSPRWLAFVAISIALVLMSQNLVALMAAPVISGYVLILGFYHKSLKYLIKCAICGIWGLALAAFTYLPALFEREFVHFSQILNLAYDTHFVTLKQLIHSPWGYGFDLPGTVNDQMSFQIGLIHLLVFFLTLLMFSYYFLKKLSFIQKVDRLLFESFHSPLLILSLFFSAVFLIAVFLMFETQPTKFVWQNFKPISLIDIPWRFLGITVLATSFLAAYVAKIIKPGLFLIFLAALVIIANRNHLRINQTIIRDDNFFKSYAGHATQYSEFTPKWRQTIRIPIDFDPNVKAQVISGEAEISNVLAKSNEISLDAQVKSTNAQIRINKFYFPGVSIKVDGRKLFPFKDLIITNPQNLLLEKEQDSSGLMLVNLERGDHKIRAKFGETPLRMFSDYLSLSSLILALGLIVKNVKK